MRQKRIPKKYNTKHKMWEESNNGGIIQMLQKMQKNKRDKSEVEPSKSTLKKLKMDDNVEEGMDVDVNINIDTGSSMNVDDTKININKGKKNFKFTTPNIEIEVSPVNLYPSSEEIFKNLWKVSNYVRELKLVSTGRNDNDSDSEEDEPMEKWEIPVINFPSLKLIDLKVDSYIEPEPKPESSQSQTQSEELEPVQFDNAKSIVYKVNERIISMLQAIPRNSPKLKELKFQRFPISLSVLDALKRSNICSNLTKLDIGKWATNDQEKKDLLLFMHIKLKELRLEELDISFDINPACLEPNENPEVKLINRFLWSQRKSLRILNFSINVLDVVEEVSPRILFPLFDTLKKLSINADYKFANKDIPVVGHKNQIIKRIKLGELFPKLVSFSYNGAFSYDSIFSSNNLSSLRTLKDLDLPDVHHGLLPLSNLFPEVMNLNISVNALPPGPSSWEKTVTHLKVTMTKNDDQNRDQAIAKLKNVVHLKALNTLDIIGFFRDATASNYHYYVEILFQLKAITELKLIRINVESTGEVVDNMFKYIRIRFANTSIKIKFY